MIDQVLGDEKVVATLTLDDVERAVPVAEALVAGGVRVIEVMFRTAAAAASIGAIRDGVSGAVVGAGTLLHPDQLDAARDAGAAFGVSPGFDERTVTAAAAAQFPFLPGAVTATEIQSCLAHDITTVKFFPASTSGGTAAIKGLAAAYSGAGVRFVPTGGVDDQTIGDYLGLASVRAVGMSWLTPATAVSAGDYAEITRRATTVSELAARSAA